MIVLTVEKTAVEGFLHALTSGGRIDVPSGRWKMSGNDMLTLAGCCFAVMFHQNVIPMLSLLQRLPQVPEDRDSFTAHLLNRDYHAAVDKICEMATAAVLEGTWDNQHGRIVGLLMDSSQYSGASVRNIDDNTNSYRS